MCHLHAYFAPVICPSPTERKPRRCYLRLSCSVHLAWRGARCAPVPARLGAGQERQPGASARGRLGAQVGQGGGLPAPPPRRSLLSLQVPSSSPDWDCFRGQPCACREDLAPSFPHNPPPHPQSHCGGLLLGAPPPGCPTDSSAPHGDTEQVTCCSGLGPTFPKVTTVSPTQDLPCRTPQAPSPHLTVSSPWSPARQA